MSAGGPDTRRLWQQARRFVDADASAPARAALESILARDPGDVRARVWLSAVHAAEDHPRAAALQVRLAAAAAPENPELLHALVDAAIRAGEIVLARGLLQRPAIAASASPELLVASALQWQLLGDNRAALAALERARRVGADDRTFHFYRGVQLGFNGDLAAAGRAFERCVGGDPPLAHAFLQLANLRRHDARDNHLDEIDAALARVDPAGVDAAMLYFARYRELEDLGDVAGAWSALCRANGLIRARAPWDVAGEAALFDRLLAACPPAFLQSTAPPHRDGPRPIFVIGLTRSGTTVLERILGNHSQVESAGELPAFAQALSAAIDHWVPASIPDAASVARLADADWGAVGDRYLAESRWRARGKSLYVDKLPRNWAWAGLIHKALPGARFVNLVRDPMDVCFSNWRAYLGDAPGYGYAYDLAALAAHHRQYRRVLDHWHRALPGVILDVDYARLVREPEAVAAEVFDFCGLPREPGCADLTRNTAPSASLSMAQIRQPIHAHAFGEWRRYARDLAGLAAALADAPAG